MKAVDLNQCMYAFYVYIQMVLFCFWVHMFDEKSVWKKVDSSYFEWSIYFIYLLFSYYFVDSVERYIGVQIVFLFFVFCQKRKKFFTEKTVFILLCLCVPEFIISCFKIGVEDIVQRYGIYKNLYQIFWAKVLQIVLFIVVAVGNRNRLVEQKISFYQNQFYKVQFFSKQIDILSHDLKHHLLTLEILIKNRAWEKATQYIEKLMGESVIAKELENTGNLVIDSIVNYKRRIALENRILFEARIEIPDEFEFDDFDMTVLLGNLLDNALYAVKGIESGFLAVAIKYNRKRLIIVIRNSVCEKEKKVLEESQYGIGLQSVMQIVLKYHGDLETGYAYGEFYAKVILFLE